MTGTTTAKATAQATATDFIKALFSFTAKPVYVCSFSNERYDDKEPGERHLLTRDAAQIKNFMTKWDRLGRGLFVCMATIDGDKRSKANAVETPALFADQDFKSIDGLPTDPVEALAKVLAQNEALKLLPSIQIKSGGGVHCYWLLKEPVETQPNIDRIEAALRQLADATAGDLPVCEVSRVLRMPGTHNTKQGAWLDVEIVDWHPERRYTIEELEEWLSEQSPRMLRKKRDAAVNAGEPDAFDEYAAAHPTFKAAIDVQARLEAMMFMGGEQASIHQTQLVCTASLLARGMPKDEVVTIVLDYTHRAAGEYGARWNWVREERKLNNMCETWLKKNPPTAAKKKDFADKAGRAEVMVNLEQKAAERVAAAKPVLKSIDGGLAGRELSGLAKLVRPPQAEARVGQDGNVVTMPLVVPNEDPHAALGRGTLLKMFNAEENLINTKDGAWYYCDGVWELRNEKQWLNVKLEHTCPEFNLKSNNKLINEARAWIERRPELWSSAQIPWDQHGKIPTLNGMVDPATGELEPMRADHFATWRVNVAFDPNATCPWWEMAIADMFSDKPDDERDHLVRIVQECFGAALIDRKSRALSKALVFWGDRNLGKSSPLDVAKGLFGGSNAAGISSVEGPHGLMPFTKRQPWILHEAFNPGQWHISSVVKSIITQEPIQINIKNGPILTQVVRSPIFWATNSQPQFKEATRAIVSRMIVIEVSRQFDEKNPVGAAAEAKRRGFDSKPAELVIATELPGVLNWAIAGLRRALARGFIEETAAVREAADNIHRDSNLVAGFIDDCVQFDPNARIRSTDFCLAHAVWFLEQKGEDRHPPSNDSIGKALKALGDGRIGAHLHQMRDKNGRYYCGMALNNRGLQYHGQGFEGRIFEGKIATATDPQKEVNGFIPGSWDDRPSVIAMRKSHAMTLGGDTSNPSGAQVSPGPSVIEKEVTHDT